MNKPIIKRHLTIMRRLCCPHAFLLQEKRSNGAYNATLIENWQRTSFVIGEMVLYRWIDAGWITSSAHKVDSFIITPLGRGLVADHEEPEEPMSMVSILRAQALARRAREMAAFSHEALERAGR